METGVDTTITLITKDLSSKMLTGPLFAAIIDKFGSGLVVRSLTATAGRIKWAPQSWSSDAQPGQQGICVFSGWGFLYRFLAQKDLHVYFISGCGRAPARCGSGLFHMVLDFLMVNSK